MWNWISGWWEGDSKSEVPSVDGKRPQAAQAPGVHSAPPAAAAAAGSADATALAVSSASPPSGDGFWGYTDPAVTASHDPALEDMLLFFGFAHQAASSEYSGAVRFELSYPDGGVAMRTVQVLPRAEGAGAQIEECEEEACAPPEHKESRVVLYDSPAEARQAVGARLRRFWPAPVCSLILPRRGHLHPTGDAATEADDPSLPPIPALPFSSRIRLFDGPLPSDVKLTAELKCPRQIFFDVYMGKLDPIQAVLTRQAVCPGWRYSELYNFGKSFDLAGHKWEEFYSVQAEIEEAKRRRGGGRESGGSSGTGGGAAPPAIGGAGGSEGNGSNRTLPAAAASASLLSSSFLRLPLKLLSQPSAISPSLLPTVPPLALPLRSAAVHQAATRWSERLTAFSSILHASHASQLNV